MRTHPPPGPTRGHRHAAELQRPIASGLKLSGRHVELIDGPHNAVAWRANTSAYE